MTAPSCDAGRAGTFSWRVVAVALLLACLQIQLTVPISAVGLKLCPADLLAPGFAAALAWTSLRHRTAPWRHRLLPWAIVAATAALLVAFAVGCFRLHTISTWALYGKLAGWAMLVAYLATGLYVGARREARFFMTALTASVVVAGIAGLLLIRVMHPLGLAPEDVQIYTLEGFVGNRNALAFLLLAALSVLLAQGWLADTVRARLVRDALIGATGVLAFYAGSRSALPTMALMIAVALVLRAVDLRALARAVLCGAALFLAVEALHTLAVLWMVGPSGLEDAPALGLSDVSGGSSDKWRTRANLLALELWQGSPVLGAGLGSTMAIHAERYGVPLIVHNTVLWLLADTGLVGLAAFLGLAWALVRPLFPLRRGPAADRAVRLAALLLVIGFVCMSMAHELLYQRVLWLVLGLAAAAPGKEEGEPCAA